MSHLHRSTEVATPAAATPTIPVPTPAVPVTSTRGEDGSMVAEYGLIAVVAATIAGVLIMWASGGALDEFFDALVSSARDLVGA